MALFGGKFQNMNLMDDVVPERLGQQMPVPVTMQRGIPAPVAQEAPWRRKAAIIGATLRDVGGAVGGVQSNALGQLTQQDMIDSQLAEQEAVKERQRAAYEQLRGATDLSQADILLAQQAGIDIDPLIEYQKAQQPRVVNTEYGAYRVNPDGTYEQIGSDPNADLRRQLIEAQIEAQKALGTQREASASYSTAKAKQPYAPPRKSSGGSSKSGKTPPWAMSGRWN